MKIKGFTPFIDMVYRHYLEAGQSQQEAMITTLVFGSVYRHSNMRKRYCDASRETMAASVGISKKTVDRRLPRLCNDGFLEDLTPGIKNKPHIYVPTEKAEIMVTMQVGQGVPADEEVGQGVLPGGTGSPSRWDRVSLEETRRNHEETNLCVPENLTSTDSPTEHPPANASETNGQVNDPTGLFTQDDLDRTLANEERRKDYEPDPANVFHASGLANEAAALDPKNSMAYEWFARLHSHDPGRIIKGVEYCESLNFTGDHAWLAAAFLIFANTEFLALDDDGKRGGDIRKGWRKEFEIILNKAPIHECIGFYYHAIDEMKQDGLTIKSPRSLESYLGLVIARIREKGQYEPRTKRAT